MPTEIRNVAAPDEISATCGETSGSADDHVVRDEVSGPDPVGGRP